jgi:hypothetical protein
MIHNHFSRHNTSQPLSLTKASCCKSRSVMLSQWLGIMLCYAEPVVMHHGVLCWASGCESWWVMMSQWLWIMVCYDETVVVNHGVLCWGRGHNHWLSITHHDSQSLAHHHSGKYHNSMSHNHCLSITLHDSQQLAQHNTPWFTTTRSA